MKEYDLTQEEASVFFEEAFELLESLDNDLILLESAQDPEVIQRIFRAFHTLKGAAGSIGHTPMARLTHSAETVLDLIRNGKLEPSTQIVDVLFEVDATLKEFIDDVVNDRPPSGDIDEQIGLLARCTGAEAQKPEILVQQLPPLSDSQKEQVMEGVDAGHNLLIVYAEADTSGIAPLARLYQMLLLLQDDTEVVLSLPSAQQLEEGQGQPVLIALVLAQQAHTQLQAQLDEVMEISLLRVADFSNATSLLLENHISDINESLTPIVHSPTRADAEPERVEAVATAQHPEKSRASSRTVRTSVERLDNLMNLAGELVTDRNRLFAIYEELSHVVGEDHLAALNEAISHLSTVTNNLHDEVFKARMQPVGYVFNKFPRLVRQIAQSLGKQVELVVSGEETEVDRSVIEQVSDPLLHLVRNAIDHGIESTEERTAAGKPSHGCIELSARSEEGNIVITISDDGCGIDGEKVKAKALALGIITATEATSLSYEEILDLVFAPGLSTAAQISSLSGRGVGMDVVRSNLQQLNGSVVAHSTPGEGSNFELRLPLTLAIIPSLLTEADGHVFALPIHHVLEISRLDSATVHTVRGRAAMYVRGEILPLIRLRNVFPRAISRTVAAAGAQSSCSQSREYVVTLTYRNTRIGAVVERLLGKQEVVTKSLSHPLDQVEGLTGATLLGDGRIGLIVDVPTLFECLIVDETGGVPVQKAHPQA